MTKYEETPLDEQALDTLRAAYQASVPAHLGTKIDDRVRERLSTVPTSPQPRRRLPRLRRSAARMAAIAAVAAALVGGGVMTQLHGSGATPVSAQTVMSRAAAAGPATGQARHLTYRLTASGGYTGTAELWVGKETGPPPDRLALVETVSRNGVPAPDLNLQFVESGAMPRTYDPATNTIVIGQPDMSGYGGLRLLLGAYLAPKIEAQLHLGSQASLAPNHRLTHSTVNGVGVYSISLGDLGTLSFNDQTYVLEAATWTVKNQTWQAHRVGQATIPLASVPAGTFELHVPANARTVQGPGASKSGDGSGPNPVDLPTDLASVCQTTPEAIKSVLGSTTNETLLQICQQTRPGISAAQLNTELLSLIKKELDAAVAAGSISRADADAEYAGLQQKLQQTASPQVNGAGKK